MEIIIPIRMFQLLSFNISDWIILYQIVLFGICVPKPVVNLTSQLTFVPKFRWHEKRME
jgi:hypothetical protein